MQIITKNQNNFNCKCNCNSIDEGDIELRKGPWSPEEDILLTQYMSCHDQGHWNSVAKCAGLKRTGKSCRLRWLNYLKPDIKRGNLTSHEQFLILELHSLWGNRWSKIAQYLPGRTDNEIKNYWRTWMHKHARQLRIGSNSQKFLEENTLMEMQQSSSSNSSQAPPPSSIVISSNMEPEKTRHSTKGIEIDSMETYNDNFYKNISTINCFDPMNLLDSYKDLSNMCGQMEEPNWICDDMTGGALW